MSQQPHIAVKILVPVVILTVLLGIGKWITANPPEQSRRGGAGGPGLTVEVMTLQPQDYQIVLESYGTVQPRTRSMLVSQVGGQITRVSPAFRDGGFFDTGDVLVEIDPRDYEADVKIAEAGWQDARQALAEAQARSRQALEDWERLGNEGEPTPLVLREPQLRAAKARVESSRAQVRKARLDLERTRIIAPYAGRVLRQSVDLGQVVGTNTMLGEIYATDLVEIRLPLRNRDLGYIDLPERLRSDNQQATPGAQVEFLSDLSDGNTWFGELVRTESAIDEAARQLHVAAQIRDPYDIAETTDQTPLKIGQYVTARISGKTIRNALVVPNQNIYQGTYVYVVDNGVLDRRTVNVTWQNETESLIAGGVIAGEQIVTTQLGQVTSGTRVTVAGAAERDRRNAGSPSAATAVPGNLSQ